MDIGIDLLQPSELRDFYPVFERVLRTEFPCYSEESLHYLLNTIYTKFNFEFWIREKSKFALVARVNGEGPIVGFALIDEAYGGVSLCRWLGVVREYQRRGIGTDLVKRWFKEARARKCHKMEVAAQSTAKTFYEKAGLDLEGFRKKSYFGADQYVFGKVIA